MTATASVTDPTHSDWDPLDSSSYRRPDHHSKRDTRACRGNIRATFDHFLSSSSDGRPSQLCLPGPPNSIGVRTPIPPFTGWTTERGTELWMKDRECFAPNTLVDMWSDGRMRLEAGSAAYADSEVTEEPDIPLEETRDRFLTELLFSIALNGDAKISPEDDAFITLKTRELEKKYPELSSAFRGARLASSKARSERIKPGPQPGPEEESRTLNKAAENVFSTASRVISERSTSRGRQLRWDRCDQRSPLSGEAWADNDG